jgi:hypothetical protein
MTDAPRMCFADCGHPDCPCKLAMRQRVLGEDLTRGIGAADMVSIHHEGWPEYRQAQLKEPKP